MSSLIVTKEELAPSGSNHTRSHQHDCRQSNNFELRLLAFISYFGKSRRGSQPVVQRLSIVFFAPHLESMISKFNPETRFFNSRTRELTCESSCLILLFTTYKRVTKEEPKNGQQPTFNEGVFLSSELIYISLSQGALMIRMGGHRLQVGANAGLI